MRPSRGSIGEGELPSRSLMSQAMYVRPLYLACFGYRCSLAEGQQPDGGEGWWKHINATAGATRAAYRR